jgi:YfiH family protein
VQAVQGPALACRPLSAAAPHLFTTRWWTLGESPAAVETGWAEVAAALGLEARQLARAHQVHGSAAVVASDSDDRLPEADIIVSARDDVGAAVQAADCVPLLLADRRTGAVAAAHAGWRGLAARVPARAVAALGEVYGSRPANLMAAIGPSIGACCYEVGGDVRDRFAAAGFAASDRSRWFLAAPAPTVSNRSMPSISARPDHWFFDAWAAARNQLEAAGLAGSAIFAAALCTASHPGIFCSYRRDGSGAGRMAGAIRSRRPHP